MDSVVVGRVVGPNALAAIGATGSVTFLFIALCNGMGSGGGIVVSQKFGAKDETGVRKSLTNAAYLMMGDLYFESVQLIRFFPMLVCLT